MSWFNFENLFERDSDTSIPKEIIFAFIGFIIIGSFVLIVNNMYLQEMLFFEGVEKSVPMFTEEELREYGEIYKELSIDFQNKIGIYAEDYANRTNRAGEKIHYGVYNHEHVEGNASKIKPHNNGQYRTGVDDLGHPEYATHINDCSIDSTYLDTEEFKNGVTIKYAKTEEREDGESNFRDILTVISMFVDQKQSKEEYKTKMPNMIKKLFKMSHTFAGTSKSLYSCEKGCRVLFYYCNEEDSDYVGTGIDLSPFQVNPNNEIDSYEEGDFTVVGPIGECEICEHAGKGCILSSEKCYHGEENEETGCRNSLGGSKDSCSLANPHYDCPGHEVSDGEGGTTTEYCSSEIGCKGHYDCPGHDHYDCNGHFYVCCMGHTDLTMNIKIMYADEMIRIIKNGYNEGEEESESE